MGPYAICVEEFVDEIKKIDKHIGDLFNKSHFQSRNICRSELMNWHKLMINNSGEPRTETE